MQCACRDSPSRLLIFHPSAPPPSDNLFDTARQSLIYRELLPGLPGPKIAGPAHSHICEDDFAYMAIPPQLTGYEPNLPDKMVPWDDDGTPINDPDHDIISDFSKTTHENIGGVVVPTVCETSISQISRGDIALQTESKESLTRETEGNQRMWRDRDSSVMSVGESMSRRSRRNSTRSHSHQTYREFYSDDRDLREHLEGRAQQASHGENSVQKKLYSTELDMEIQNLERRNSEYALFESHRDLGSQSQQLLMANHRADQAQRERIQLCSELEMKKSFSSRMLRKKLTGT